MATAYTSLLGLALPVTGELSGTWGNTVNTEITALLDSAIAGTTTISADADITLTTTTGAANESREAIILWTAGGTATRNITAPAQSKAYIVINKSSSTQSIVLRGAGPTTGVTIIKGEAAVCAWDGSDFIKVSNISGAGVFSSLTVTGTTTLSGLTASTALALDASKNVVSVTNTGTGNNVLATSPTLVTPALGTPSSGVVTNLTGTASININGTVGATTPSTGSFTSLSDSGNLTFTGTGNRITGDFSNATQTNRVSFQTSTVNGNTSIAAIPNGTSVSSNFVAFTTADPTNSSFIRIRADGTSATTYLESGTSGSGTNLPMTFYTGGSERVRIDTSGNVGIGASSPVDLLQINRASGSGITSGISLTTAAGSAGDGSYIKWTGAGAGEKIARIDGVQEGTDTGSIRFNTGNGADGFTERMRIDSSGNVGIGTTSPVTNLNISSASAATGGDGIQYVQTTYTGTGTVNSGYTAKNYYGTSQFFQWENNGTRLGNRVITNAGGGNLIFTYGNDSEGMRIDSSGNVGIGTTSPSKRLSLRTSSADVGMTFGAGANAYNQDIDFLNSVDSMSGRIRYYADSGFMSFWTASTERMRIDSSGNLFLNCTTVPTSNSTGIINAIAGGDGINLKQTADGNNMLNLWQTGTTTYAAITFNKGATQTNVGSINVTTSATSYSTSSDYRLKEAIAPMTGALAKVAALKPVTYKWKLDGSDAEGFIAHELAEVSPQCVSGAKDAVDADGNPEYQGIDTSFLVATLTAAIQEQQALITSLTARITALEST